MYNIGGGGIRRPTSDLIIDLRAAGGFEPVELFDP